MQKIPRCSEKVNGSPFVVAKCYKSHNRKMLTGSNPRSQDTVTTEKTASDNFGILSRHAPLLEQLCASLERNLTSPEPNTCLLKLQQFGEALAQHVAALLGIAPPGVNAGRPSGPSATQEPPRSVLDRHTALAAATGKRSQCFFFAMSCVRTTSSFFRRTGRNREPGRKAICLR